MPQYNVIDVFGWNVIWCHIIHLRFVLSSFFIVTYRSFGAQVNKEHFWAEKVIPLVAMTTLLIQNHLKASCRLLFATVHVMFDRISLAH